MGFDSPNSDHEDVVKCVTDSEINKSVQKKMNLENANERIFHVN